MKLMYGVLALAALAASWFVYKNSRLGVASPEYRVVESDGPFEIRDYPDMVVVGTPMADADPTEGTSFMRLFRYISGSNEAEQKISMTTPVMTSQKDGGLQMSFIVPEDVADGGAPLPTADAVVLETVPGGRFASVRFSGRWTDERFEEAAAELEKWLESRDLRPAGLPIIANYDPPFTPPMLRRNEVWIRLDS